MNNNDFNEFQSKNGLTLLHWAAMPNYSIDEIKFLLQKEPELINFKNKYNDNAFLIAIRVGNLDLIKFFVKETKIDIYQKNDQGNGFLVAMRYGQSEIAQYLLENTDINAKVKDVEKRNIFNFIAFHGDDFMLEKMYKIYSSGINNVDLNNENILFSYINNFLSHKNYLFLDILFNSDIKMSKKILTKKNKNNLNLIEYIETLIEESETRIEKILKKEKFEPILFQLRSLF